MEPVISGTKSSDAEVTSDSINDRDGNKSVCKTNAVKKKIKVLTPTSEQLASLNLKEGKNIVTFTFSTAMLGRQQVAFFFFFPNAIGLNYIYFKN